MASVREFKYCEAEIRGQFKCLKECDYCKGCYEEVKLQEFASNLSLSSLADHLENIKPNPDHG